ncbi:MAG: hypothetical protein HYS81_03820 [Candidatus Aenigmatarchaeota archaeon]|nr:MAG: hypothetical protein HYS81_03820 [Candidatus Aenigmarchaeota archaeon]
MGLEDVLKFAWETMWHHPKTLLLGVINWIPAVFALSYIAFLLSELTLLDLGSIYSVGGMIALIWKLAPLIAGYTVLSWAASAFSAAAYASLTQQFAHHKKPSVSDAFYTGKRLVLPMMWLQFLTGLVVALPIIVALAVSLLVIGGAGAATAGSGSITALIAGMGLFASLLIVAFAVTFYLSIKTWLAPVALVVENRRGFDAVKRSFELTKGKFWHILLVLIVMGVVNNVVFQIAASVFQVMVLGSLTAALAVYFSFVLLVMLPFGMWAMTAPAALYFEYGLGKTPTKVRK